MAILSFCSVTKNAPVKKNFTGAPPVHRWCGEIVKYLTLSTNLDWRRPECDEPRSAARGPDHGIVAVEERLYDDHLVSLLHQPRYGREQRLSCKDT